MSFVDLMNMHFNAYSTVLFFKLHIKCAKTLGIHRKSTCMYSEPVLVASNNSNCID